MAGSAGGSGFSILPDQAGEAIYAKCTAEPGPAGVTVRLASADQYAFEVHPPF
jgi:hypothetical protein